MVTVAYIVVLLMALLPQLLFTILYWKWIPIWIANPYGRFAQLDAWSLILLFLIFLTFIFVGSDWSLSEKRFLLAICFTPFVFLGFFKLSLLKKAVNSADKKEGEQK